MTRTMYDSTTAGDCPRDGDLYAGYIDGRYADYGAMVQDFPDRGHVRISVDASGSAADVLDVENGDATPAQAPGWVGRQRALGTARPTLYCNRGNEGAVDQALHDAGVAAGDAAFWIATLDGTMVSGATAHGYPIVACQSEGSAQTGGHYDRSVVFDAAWPGAAAPAPQPPTDMPVPGEDDTVTKTPVTIPTNANGEGFAQTGIPFDTVVALFHNGSDPETDGHLFPGEVHGQMHASGHLLVTIGRARPEVAEIVWVTHTA